MTFNLEAFDPDEALPQNARLDDPEDLIGHKVVAVVEDCAGRLALGGELVREADLVDEARKAA